MKLTEDKVKGLTSEILRQLPMKDFHCFGLKDWNKQKGARCV